MKIQRKKTRKIKLGGLDIGGGSPVSVQSMTKSKINNTAAIKSEIKELIDCGCEVIRIAVPEKEAVHDLKKLIDDGIFTDIPVVADIIPLYPGIV